MSGIAEATLDKRRIGRLHRNSGGEVKARRNRQRLYTACGARLDMAFPFPVEDVPWAQRCAKCFPQQPTPRRPPGRPTPDTRTDRGELT